jgi:hypothetical protein
LTTLPLRRLGAGLVVVVCTALGVGAAPASARGSATKGIVARTGAQLQVAGQPWTFAGYNLPCAQPFGMTSGQLGTYLDAVRFASKGNVVRVWFFQSNGGPGNWAGFDRVVAGARKRGMRIIPTLVNHGAGCEPSPTGQPKTVDWYETGYTQTGDGYPLSFRDFAAQVAARYANEPAIAFWQLVNEAEPQTPAATGGTVCDNTRSMNALRSFSDAMVRTIRGAGAKQLVNLGTQGSGQCGTNGSAAYKYVHDGLLDLCEYHDYGAANVAMPALLAQRIDDCHTLASGPKPIFVGESGIVGDVQADGSPKVCDPWPDCTGYAVTIQTLSRRASFFTAKMQAASGKGVAGYEVWFKSPFYDPNGDPYAIGTNDPTEGAMAAAVASTGSTTAMSPAAVVSESPFPVLLVVPLVAIAIGAAAVIARRRRRRGSAKGSGAPVRT